MQQQLLSIGSWLVMKKETLASEFGIIERLGRVLHQVLCILTLVWNKMLHYLCVQSADLVPKRQLCLKCTPSQLVVIHTLHYMLVNNCTTNLYT